MKLIWTLLGLSSFILTITILKEYIIFGVFALCLGVLIEICISQKECQTCEQIEEWVRPQLNRFSFNNTRQIKKDEDLMGKSSGDTNFDRGSHNHLKDCQRDKQSAEIKLNSLKNNKTK